MPDPGNGFGCILEGMSRGWRVHAALAVVIVVCGAAGVAGCGSDDDGAVGFGTAGCVSDQQICQFKKSVSTKADVQKVLGNAQLYLTSNTWGYICQIVSSQVIRNDQTIFDFDDSDVLPDITFLRQGTGSTPPPDCWEGGSGGAGGAMM